jgi:glycosyltransferase involved in cell wall biosynthesis
MRITLVVDDLRGGGAARVMTLLANYWSHKGWDISFVTMNHGQAERLYALNQSVAYQDLNYDRLYAGGFPKLRYARCLIHLRNMLKATHPDIIISFLAGVNVDVLLAMAGCSVPIIVSERNDSRYDPLDSFRKRLRRLIYPRASFIVVQTSAALDILEPPLRVRGRSIPNPVVVVSTGSRPPNSCKQGSTGKRVIAMGRLADQKGFDMLINAFGQIAARHPEWTLVIYGEGGERQRLEALVEVRGLGGKVRLPGSTNIPHEMMCHSDLFVLSSRYEGYPNVLCEAMACGLPVISFDCPNGPAEIIRNAVDGVLVPNNDEMALAAALERLMDNEEERLNLATRAPEILERLSITKVAGLWEELILKALNHARKD